MLFSLPVVLNQQILNAGADVTFHLNRIASIQDGINHGSWVYGVDFQTFKGVTAYGLFYPYLLNALPIVFLQYIVQNWQISFFIFFVLSTLLAEVLSYRACVELTKSKKQAFIFSTFYVFSYYRMLDLYSRFDVAEYMALTFLPLILISCELMIERHDYKKWYWLAFGMTAIIYSHLLTALLISGVLAARIILSWYNVTPRLFASIIKAAGVTIVLSLFQIAPIVEQFINLPISSVAIVPLESKVQTPAISLASAINNNIPSFTIGLVVVICAILAFVRIPILGDSRKEVTLELGWGVFLWAITTTLFPWEKLNQTSVEIIQYPFRLLAFSTFYILLAGTRTLYASSDNKAPSLRSATSFLFLCMAPVLIFANTSFTVSRIAHENAQRKGLAGKAFNPWTRKGSATFDYVPKNTQADRDSIYNKKFSVDGEPYSDNIHLLSKSKRFFFSTTTEKIDTEINTPIIAYKGFQVTDNGRPLTYSISKRKTISISLKRKGIHNVSIKYEDTLLRKTTLAISSTALFIVVFCFFRGKTKQSTQLMSKKSETAV